MSSKINPDRPSNIPPSTASAGANAAQETSEGPKLGAGMRLFLKFVWLITSAWTKASFSDWMAKKEFVNSLTDKEMKPTDKSYYTALFNSLSLDELKVLQQLFTEHPGVARTYIEEAKDKNPKHIYAILKQVVSDFQTSERIFMQIATLQSLGKTEFTGYQGIQDAFNKSFDQQVGK